MSLVGGLRGTIAPRDSPAAERHHTRDAGYANGQVGNKREDIDGVKHEGRKEIKNTTHKRIRMPESEAERERESLRAKA